MSKFDFNKVKDFDKHIRLSIPNYDWLVNEIVQFSKYFIDENTNVYDIGCSTGTLIKRLATSVSGANYIGVDNSNLIPKSDEIVTFMREDLRKFKAMSNASFITSIFTLQFLPRAERAGVIEKIADALNRGGGFIVCEKTYSKTARMQDIVNSKYYQFKERHFPAKDIIRKEQQLRENLRLQTLEELMKEFSKVGSVDIFWRSYNFVGFVVVKE